MSEDPVGTPGTEGSGPAGTGPADGLAPGTNVLVAGPPMVGKSDFLVEALAAGGEDDAAVVVSTDNDERTVLSTFDRLAPGFDRSSLGVVECSSGAASDGTATVDGARVRRVASPADLTGIGIGASELVGEFAEAGADRVRIGVDSVSTLLLYADFDRTCRFLHVLSGRIDRAGGVGLFAVDPGTIDPRQFDQLKTLFDGLVEIRESEAGPECRVRGLPGADGAWRPFDRPGQGLVP